MILDYSDPVQLGFADRALNAALGAIYVPEYGIAVTAETYPNPDITTDEYLFYMHRDTLYNEDGAILAPAFNINGYVTRTIVGAEHRYNGWTDGFCSEQMIMPYDSTLNERFATLYAWAVSVSPGLRVEERIQLVAQIEIAMTILGI